MNKRPFRAFSSFTATILTFFIVLYADYMYASHCVTSWRQHSAASAWKWNKKALLQHTALDTTHHRLTPVIAPSQPKPALECMSHHWTLCKGYVRQLVHAIPNTHIMGKTDNLKRWAELWNWKANNYRLINILYLDSNWFSLFRSSFQGSLFLICTLCGLARVYSLTDMH